MVKAEFAGENILKGGLKGSWTGLKEVAGEGAKGIADVVSAQAWKNTAKELTSSVGSGLKRAGNILTGEEGLTLGKGAGEGVEAAAKAKDVPLIGTKDWGKQQQIRRAAASGDPDVVAGLYRDGGMKDLIDMQKKGVCHRRRGEADQHRPADRGQTSPSARGPRTPSRSSRARPASR